MLNILDGNCCFIDKDDPTRTGREEFSGVSFLWPLSFSLWFTYYWFLVCRSKVSFLVWTAAKPGSDYQAAFPTFYSLDGEFLPFRPDFFQLWAIALVKV